MFGGDVSFILMSVWLLWLLQAAWACWNILHFRGRIERWDTRNLRREKVGRLCTAPAVVIVAVKGVDHHFERHVTGLLNQDYPRYRLLFTVESEQDPAYAAVRALGGEREHEIELVIAGEAERGGQKVHNLLAALRHLREEDEAIVFADADVAPDEQWLRRLVGPLAREWVGATTGYRWLVPADDAADNLATRLASAINASIATLQGTPRRTHAWGGSTALLRTTLDDAKIIDYWQGALSDDYQLTRAMRALGKVVLFVPRSLVASPARFTWASLMEFGRRQYVITRVYAPGIWLLALLFQAIYLGGWVSVVVAAAVQVPGWGWGVVAAAGVYGFDVLRGKLRGDIALEAMGPEPRRKLRGALRLEQFAMPLVVAVHLLLVLRSAVGRRITWAGIRYDMRGRQEVTIEGRGPRE